MGSRNQTQALVFATQVLYQLGYLAIPCLTMVMFQKITFIDSAWDRLHCRESLP